MGAGPYRRRRPRRRGSCPRRQDRGANGLVGGGEQTLTVEDQSSALGYFNAMGYLDGNTFICQAEGTFSARPVRKKRRG
ncbi:MAG TPA: hypothetical protein VF549_17690 [Solirubrobacteraceae bacterium]|jgi:hypothetical protein